MFFLVDSKLSQLFFFYAVTKRQFVSIYFDTTKKAKTQRWILNPEVILKEIFAEKLAHTVDELKNYASPLVWLSLF